MPIVLVHGVPETDAIWDEFRAHLTGRESITVSPPGFGVPVPDGFGATSDDYVAWLTAELEGALGPDSTGWAVLGLFSVGIGLHLARTIVRGAV